MAYNSPLRLRLTQDSTRKLSEVVAALNELQEPFWPKWTKETALGWAINHAHRYLCMTEEERAQEEGPHGS